MSRAILGRKVGMTQIFTEDGSFIPVTVIEAGPCVVVQKKTVETDGYNAIQIGFANQKPGAVTKPIKGHFNKADVKPLRYLREIRVDNPDDYQVGQEVKIEDIFKAGDFVDVTGISKGKGFTGSIKAHGFSRGPMSHGSHYHRGSGALGSLGPNRVFKGRPLPGRRGSDRVTVQKLEVVKTDNEQNLLLVKGSVPGAKKTIMMVKDSVKA
ncbi:50S ribosomal protein L3 [Metallumcola ferriviriculae]|uniref:Large ribosomal subunit protein uL3 n=1 Tax=Metallumcola ferriviriculae TaxID=3039180 RepID=A0AAU0UI01_9FIRM|nr:50S ribosomal protein L3 [Desulfitibacteraceae bacterium MK1]